PQAGLPPITCHLAFSLNLSPARSSKQIATAQDTTMQTLTQYQADKTDIRALYQSLLHAPTHHLSEARHFLRSQLQLAAPHLADLPDDRFLQGTLQLALGQLAGEFLPEIIGFNLGYEQLPLHLLISTYELTELGIDAHYFRLHITIDNASTGHARRAARAVLDNLPSEGQQAFWRRVRQGYQLNELGASSTSVITDFNLDRELCRVLEDKARGAGHMHSDFCRVDGRTINEWLDSSGQIAALLDALQQKGWIKRHQDPANSRFWRLIQSNRAPMFGVLSDYELQQLHDWLAGEWLEEQQLRITGRRGSPSQQDPLVEASHRNEEVAL